VESTIKELCRLIAAETNQDRLQELARELNFLVNESTLQLQNRNSRLNTQQQVN